MAKFLVIQDYTASGTNVTPYGSEIPNFNLTFPYHQGQTVEGEGEEGFIVVHEKEGILADGNIFAGDTVFTIPMEYVNLVREGEPLPPIPAPSEDVIRATPTAPLDVFVMNGDLIPEYSSPKSVTEEVKQPVENQPVQETSDSLFIKYILVMLILGIIGIILVNC